jgi:hypothetical protein
MPRRSYGQPIFVQYRTGAGKQRIRFAPGRMGDALAHAEFISRVEGCTVVIRHGERGRPVVACP